MQKTEMNFRTDMSMIEQAYFNAAGDDGRLAIAEGDRQLLEMGLEASAVQAGDMAPEFLLENALGGTVSLRGRLLGGPVVLSFFRGGWCPFCRAELQAMSKAAQAVEQRGASLLAVSPQSLADSVKMARTEALTIPLLADASMTVASDYGLAFELPESLRLPALAGGMVAGCEGNDWRVPMPATYVISTDGIIRYSFLDPNYRNRLDPALLVNILDRL